MFPVIALVIIDLLNNKIIDKNDVKRGTTAPILGFISHNNSDSEIPVNEKPGSTLTESFRSVRTNIKNLVGDIEKPVLAVSSTISSEGKTFISMNLAVVLASLNKKVLLTGLDLRRPRIHSVFGLDNSIGMSNYLSGTKSFDEIIKETGVSNLFYAPSGPVPPNPAELIDSKKMKEFIERARKEFDYVIIDTPPVAIVTDALLLNSLVDSFLLVVRQRFSSRNTLTLIEELYETGTISKMGIIINDISLSGYYGYGLRYGYSVGYGYTYGYNYYGKYVNKKYGYTNDSNPYYDDL